MKLEKKQQLNTLINIVKQYENESFILNDAVQCESGDIIYNVDDHGVAFINDDVDVNLIDLEEKIDEYLYSTVGKEEANAFLNKELFYWLDITFLNEWLEKWNESYNPLTRECITEFIKLCNIELDK